MDCLPNLASLSVDGGDCFYWSGIGCVCIVEIFDGNEGVGETGYIASISCETVVWKVVAQTITQIFKICPSQVMEQKCDLALDLEY